MTRALQILLVLQVILGCNTTGKTQRASPQNKQCVPQQTQPQPAKQGLAIVNGQPTSAFPAVVLLVAVEGQSIGICTGTFVGHNVVATAAHCVDKSVSGNVKVLPGISSINIQDEFKNGQATISKGLVPTQVITNGETMEQRILPNGNSASTSQIPTDLALLILPANSAPDIMPLNTAPIQNNTTATIVGFGLADRTQKNPTVMTKRQGSLLISPDTSILGTLVSLSKPKFWSTTYSSTAQGDSGGPVIVGTQLAGITSVGSSGGILLGGDESVFVDLTNQTAKTLIDRARAAGAIFGPNSGTATTPQSPIANQQQQNCI